MMMTPSPSFGTPATEPNRPAPALRRGAFLCFSLAVSGTKSLPRAIREGENPLSNAEHPAASGLRQGSTVPPILPPSPLRFAPLRRQQNRPPHRPLRGRFPVLAPTPPPPLDASSFPNLSRCTLSTEHPTAQMTP